MKKGEDGALAEKEKEEEEEEEEEEKQFKLEADSLTPAGRQEIVV